MRAGISFRCLFTPNSLFASILPWTGWVGAQKQTLFPGAGTPRYATVYRMLLITTKWKVFTHFCCRSNCFRAQQPQNLWRSSETKKAQNFKKPSNLKILLNIRFVGAALSTYAVSFIPALKAWCAVACCMHRERWIPSHCDETISHEFAALAIWKHCDASVSQTTRGR